MAKLTFLIALLAALLIVVHTTCASRSWEEDSCSRQLERVNLRHCENHVWQRIQQKQQQEEEGEGEGEGEEDVLKLRAINYNIPRRKSSSSSGQQQQQQQQQEEEERELNKCCEQLEEVNSPKCQCRALQQIMESQSEQLQGKEQARLMEQELKKLPRMCGMGPMRRCDLSSEDD